MLHYQADLFNLNEKFSNMFCKSDSKINSNLLIKLDNLQQQSMFCYWCENRSLVQCLNCKRNFCKFCLKIDQSKVERNLLCLICGCFELTETMSQEAGDESTNLNCIDREMQDMLHRYENLCTNDKLANSVLDILINIDSMSSSKISLTLEMIKLNIVSMLHDIQKIQIMIDHAQETGRFQDIDNVLIPLLKLITKHHIFKRLGKPVPSCNFHDSPNGADPTDRASSPFIDLVNEKSMDEFQSQSSDSENYERMQRSPLNLRDEEKFTAKFEIDLKDDEDEDDDNDGADNGHDDQESMMIARNQKSLDYPKTRRNRSSDQPAAGKRKRGRPSMESDRTFCLRSETSMTANNNPSSSLQRNLSEAITVFKQSTVLEPLESISTIHSIAGKKARVSSRKIAKSPSKLPGDEEISFQSFLEMSRSFPADVTNEKGDDENVGGDLGKFIKIVQRSKNSHLVCPAPVSYEKPFLLKEVVRSDPLCDGKPIANKTWSWERQSSVTGPRCIPIKTKAIATNGDLSKRLVTKALVTTVQKPPGLFLEPPIRNTSVNHEKNLTLHSLSPSPGVVNSPFQFSPKEKLQLKRTLSAVSSSISDQLEHEGEPKKKRGRPRKYFNNFVLEPFRVSASCSSHDENLFHQNPSHLSD